jgi:DNA-directed RNA polymerase subunit RPC12/RpoP
MVFEKDTNELLFDCIAVDGTDTNEIIDVLSYNENPRGTFEGVYEEDSDSFDDTFNNEQTNYRDYLISLESFDDQGDIVYMWNISLPDGTNTDTDEKYYNTKEEALNIAKAKIDYLIDGITPEIKPEPKCPYCGRKIAKAGIFYYSCLNCGKIHKNQIKF